MPKLRTVPVVLQRPAVESVLASVLRRVPEARFRLVGTASSVLRGIDLPANDIDILFQARPDVDAWFDVLSTDLNGDDAPAWIAESRQYFARLHAEDVAIELSTVEIDSPTDTMECVGTGPWRYFDLVDCGPHTVPAVATELRLITEVSRGRADRSRPLLDHLRTVGCDVALIRRGLVEAGVAPGALGRVVSPGERR